MRAAVIALLLVALVTPILALASDTDLIAYFYGQWEDVNIYTIPAGGGTPTQLTENAGNNFDPEWSPDGTRIVFQSDRDGTDRVYVMNADGSEQLCISPPGTAARNPSWSSDGSQILFTINGGISVMHPDGSNLQALTNPSLRAWNAKSALRGSQIVFETAQDGDAEIYIMDADGSNVVKLTDNGIDDQHPVLSPDGLLVAFNSSVPGQRDFDLYIMRADGSDVRRLTTHWNHDEYASWSSDGLQLVYTWGNEAIYIINADGSGNRQLTPARDWTGGPAWQPTGDAE